MRTRLTVSLLSLLAALLVTSIFAGKGALQDTHWDAPIYLSRGKEAAQTHYLGDYLEHAGEIALRLPEFDVGEDTPYWGFLRIGNTMLLGAMTAVLGANPTSIQAAFLFYGFLLSAALVLSVLLAAGIVHSLYPRLPYRAVVGGSILSGLLYLASDVYRYMSGTFVAELPAMLLLALCTFVLVRAHQRRSVALAIWSGVFAFTLFLVKMEAVWSYIGFTLIFAAFTYQYARDVIWWPALSISALCAMTLYCIYAWGFWPLSDPRLFLAYVDAHRTVPANPTPPIQLWIVAGGLLWLGLLAAMRYSFRNPALWLAIAWLVWTTLPYLRMILNHGPAQTRMFTLIMPPLLLASTVGLATLLSGVRVDHGAKRALALILGCALALALVSQNETYKCLRGLPGGWHLQYLKAFLSPPRYERLDFALKDLSAISRFVYADGVPTVLIRDPRASEENFNIIFYLGSSPLRSSVDMFVAQTPHIGMCGPKRIQLASDSVAFCKEAPSGESLGELADAGVRVMYLRPIDINTDEATENGKTVYASGNWALTSE